MINIKGIIISLFLIFNISAASAAIGTLIVFAFLIAAAVNLIDVFV